MYNHCHFYGSFKNDFVLKNFPRISLFFFYLKGTPIVLSAIPAQVSPQDPTFFQTNVQSKGTEKGEGSGDGPVGQACWSLLLMDFAHFFFFLRKMIILRRTNFYLVSSSFPANSTSSSSFQTCHHDYDDMTDSKRSETSFAEWLQLSAAEWHIYFF